MVEELENNIWKRVKAGESLAVVAEDFCVSAALVDRIARKRQAPQGQDRVLAAPEHEHAAWKPSARAAELIRAQGLVLAPNPPRCSARDAEILDATFADLRCFQSIADQHGITRERVRQIVLAHTGLTARDVISARSVQQGHDHSELLRGLVWRHMLNDPAAEKSIEDLARATCLSVAVVTAALPVQQQRLRAGDAGRFARTSATLSDDTIFAELRRVAELCAPGPMKASFFDAHRAPGFPGEQVLAKRYGTWRLACGAAGVPSVPPPPRTQGYTLLWTDEQLTAAVDDYLLAHPTQRVSMQKMTRWLREQPTTYPSAGIIRDRLGRFSTIVAQRTHALIAAGRVDPYA